MKKIWCNVVCLLWGIILLSNTPAQSSQAANSRIAMRVSKKDIASTTPIYESQEPQLKSEFFTEPGHQCRGGIAMRLTPTATPNTPDYWGKLFNYLFTEKKIRKIEVVNGQQIELYRYINNAPDDFVTVSVSSNGSPLKRLPLQSITTTFAPDAAELTGELIVCLDPQSIPASSFGIKVEFADKSATTPKPPALTGDFKQGGLSGAQSPSLKDAAALPGEVGQRPLERNLDLGLSFTSSRDTTKDPVTMKNITQRNNRGVLDLRLIPFLNIQRHQVPPFNQKWFPFWTPIFIDANLATGKITQDTLSLNRIEFGSELEYRFIPFKKRIVEGKEETVTGHYTTFYRFMMKGKHASDRDFKQKEVAFSGEFQPIIAALNHPLEANWKIGEDPITKKQVFQFGRFGWEFKPKFGFDFGRTYSRDNPAAAVKPSPNVRRFYTQMDIVLDLTPHFKASVTEIFYIRGEFAENRKKNYFKAEILFPLGTPFSNASQAMFINYENGNRPPFNKPDVSAFRIGYRIRANGWFGQRR